MAEHADPGNKSADEVQDEQWECLRLRSEGLSIREIAAETGLTRSTVQRRLDDVSILGQTTGRDVGRAMQEVRLEGYTRALHNALAQSGDRPEAVAKLVHAGVQIERRRSALWGLDEPSRKAVDVTTNGRTLDAEEAPVGPWLRSAVAAGEQLNQADERADQNRGN